MCSVLNVEPNFPFDTTFFLSMSHICFSKEILIGELKGIFPTLMDDISNKLINIYYCASPRGDSNLAPANIELAKHPSTLATTH